MIEILVMILQNDYTRSEYLLLKHLYISKALVSQSVTYQNNRNFYVMVSRKSYQLEGQYQELYQCFATIVHFVVLKDYKLLVNIVERSLSDGPRRCLQL